MDYRVIIEQEKTISRFGWFWTVEWAGRYSSSYTFTKAGAKWAANNFIKRQERGESNKREIYTVKGEAK